jgi:hypothetical protein
VVVRRAVLAAVVGGLAAALSLVAAYFLHPGLTFEMDRPLPPFISGMYGNERDAQGSFAWTSGEVTAAIAGLDRQVAWSCTIRFRGARPDGEPAPILTVEVDGRQVSQVPGTRDYQDLGVLVPPAADPGATIVMKVAPTFRPAGGDPRTLGVQIDRFLCRPSSALVRPPSNTLSNAGLAEAIFAGGLALVGLSLSSAMFASAIIGLGQAVMMAIGSGMYGGYSGVLPWLAIGVILPAFVLARFVETWRRQPLNSSARFVVAAAACVTFLELAGLYHPAKAIIDAVFHAHRLEWVLGGRFFFEQPMPDGVTFPYAIGLYVFTAPWTWVTSDHVALIRAVAVSANVAAGVLLYPVLLHAWNDRRAAAFASVLIQLAPLPLATLSSANLTNLFGQSMALATLAAATTWRLDPKRYGSLAGFAALVAWALCSHVSTVTTLSATLGVLVVLYWWRGDEARRRAALAIVIATGAALLFSWLVYYRHFMETYRFAFTRMFAQRTPEELAAAAVVVKGAMGTAGRVKALLAIFLSSYGWPLLLLAALGVWSLARRGKRGRLESALLAWAAVWVVFSASTVFAPVGDAYVRYSAEFLGRINLATLPLFAILAARGAAFGWQADAPASLRRVLQIASIVLVIGTLLGGLWTWLGWIY